MNISFIMLSNPVIMTPKVMKYGVSGALPTNSNPIPTSLQGIVQCQKNGVY